MITLERDCPVPHRNNEKDPLLRMQGIGKSFSGVTVLKNVSFDIYAGEVHTLMGENGAGKSTLMKIMSGVYRQNEGKIFFRNQEIQWNDPLQARKSGISIIHQELQLSPNLSIGENILMGTKLPKTKFGLVDWKSVEETAKRVLESIGADLNPRKLVSSLSIAQQQMVEIARALSFKAEVLIMDEPTASLTDKEIDKLFTLIEDLKKQGVAIVYISHRMDEIFRVSDRCTVLRDGQWIASSHISDTNPEQLVKQMVGRELSDLFVKTNTETIRVKEKEPVLELRDVSDKYVVKNASLQLYPGEIVGLAGLVGAGRTELARIIFGASGKTSGSIFVEGKRVSIGSPIEAIQNGIGFVPESRKDQGLFLNLSVKENIMMAELRKYCKASILQWNGIAEETDSYVKELGIKVSSPEQKVVHLSGGNQQKVVIARWLSIQPKVLLLDEPTRGVDVGAKTEIYKIITGLAQKGLAVLMISSELPEILAISDRILVMHEGRIKANLPRKEATQEKIMYFATGEVK
ncbi:sugar ABC transporter ATP-binding protein [Brevibacillus formosus]|uniref:sugar ABC transporter ATP-binding protein n=1 Tax=Brevibacillus formosus TaxID=54913 RepID=UPI003F1B3A46